MKNKTEELNGHSALSKPFNPALSATSHPPFPFKLNSLRYGTCENRGWQGNVTAMMEQRPGTGQMCPGGRGDQVGQDLNLCWLKGEGGIGWGAKKERKNTKEHKKKRAQAVGRWKEKKDRGCDANSAGRAGGISRGTDINSSRSPSAPGEAKKHELFASRAERVRKQRIAQRATGKQKDRLDSRSL